MRPEHTNIHNALHGSNKPHTVEVNGIHRIIKKNRNGRRYLIYTDSDKNDWMCVAIAPYNTLITKMFMKQYLTTERYKIRKYVP